MAVEEYDYIIVGAGSSGCVLAERLSVDDRRSVLVLEAGSRSEDTLIKMPKGIGKLAGDPRYSWVFKIDQPREPGGEANEWWVRGRGLGGSSLINGMIYIRGQPADYDQWVAKGAHGWGWAEMKGAFRSIENHELGDNGNRGSGGPLRISAGHFRYPLSEKMIEAGRQMGLSYHEDLNDEDQEGVGYYPHNISKGRRQSAWEAFLKPASKRPNVRILRDTLVNRIVFNGKRASEVIATTDGVERRFKARGEIIISAGTILSPTILQRSGIGDASHLQLLGIEPIAHAPDVGERLLEHVNFSLPYRLVGTRGNNHRFYGAGLALSVAEYFLTGKGPLATGPYEVGAFVRTSPEETRPNAQLYLSAFSFDRTAKPGNFAIQLSRAERKPGMTIAGQLLNATSEGRIRIADRRPDAPPTIEPNWLTTDYDRKALVDMIKYMRRYIKQPALSPYIGEELVLGEDVVDDQKIFELARRLVRCGTHGVATCRMGSDPTAVVDARARVRGVDGLRVVDCSIMPSLISGNTNGPAMALGWRAAQLIRQDGLA